MVRSVIGLTVLHIVMTITLINMVQTCFYKTRDNYTLTLPILEYAMMSMSKVLKMQHVNN